MFSTCLALDLRLSRCNRRDNMESLFANPHTFRPAYEIAVTGTCVRGWCAPASTDTKDRAGRTLPRTSVKPVALQPSR